MNHIQTDHISHQVTELRGKNTRRKHSCAPDLGNTLEKQLMVVHPPALEGALADKAPTPLSLGGGAWADGHVALQGGPRGDQRGCVDRLPAGGQKDGRRADHCCDEIVESITRLVKKRIGGSIINVKKRIPKKTEHSKNPLEQKTRSLFRAEITQVVEKKRCLEVRKCLVVMAKRFTQRPLSRKLENRF